MKEKEQIKKYSGRKRGRKQNKRAKMGVNERKLGNKESKKDDKLLFIS